jgi:hypothetical protein
MFDPSHDIIEEESTHLFLCFCTFVNTLRGKKLSVQNVFVETLKDEKLKNIFKNILTIETDQQLVQTFLGFDPSIAKSKFVTKWTRSVEYNKTTKKTKNT